MKTNNITKRIQYSIAALLIFSVLSCETVETQLTDDPSNLGGDEASIEFLLNSTQLELADFFETTQFAGAEVTRMENMGVSPVYLNNYSFTSFDGVWLDAYSDFLNDAQLLKQQASDLETEEANGNNILAVAQIMESYVITTLVDYFGDVPYSEALQGSDNFNPKRDAGEDIYAAARALLEDAVVLINSEGSVPLPTDLYYGGDMSSWEALANSLLLRLTMQSRLQNSNATAQFNELLNRQLISNNNDDFQFDYSTTREPVDSRHPNFGFQYDATAVFYQSMPFMLRMEDDPRFNYYFYEQNGEIFGRNHGDSGPPVASELNQITVYGLYPVGGMYNDGSTGPTGPLDGAAGAGASVIMTNFSTQFYLAEGYLMLNGNQGAARTALENGIEASMSKVVNFRSSAIPPDADEPSQADIDAYIDGALARYDGAGTVQQKLDVIMTEFYKSLWGNGIDTYNNYRRTSYPSDVQPSINGNPGVFTNTMWYPAIYVNNNNNPDAQQKNTVGVKTWWAEGTSFNLDF